MNRFTVDRLRAFELPLKQFHYLPPRGGRFQKLWVLNKGVLEIHHLDASQTRATFSACVFYSESESSLITQGNLTWLESWEAAR